MLGHSSNPPVPRGMPAVPWQERQGDRQGRCQRYLLLRPPGLGGGVGECQGLRQEVWDHVVRNDSMMVLERQSRTSLTLCRKESYVLL